MIKKMKLSQQRIFPIEKFVSFSEKHKAMGIAEGLSKFSKISKVNNKLKTLEKKKLFRARFKSRKQKQQQVKSLRRKYIHKGHLSYQYRSNLFPGRGRGRGEQQRLLLL